MSRDHTGCTRGFHQASRAYYATFRKSKFDPSVIVIDGGAGRSDWFTFGLYHPDGGTSGEMTVGFEPFKCGKVLPRLKCNDDGWGALASFSDLIARMGAVDDENITPENFRKMLLECGFTDLTKEKQE